MNEKKQLSNNIEATYQDFIGVYENAFDQQFCDKLINLYELYNESGRIWNSHPNHSRSTIDQMSSTVLPCMPDELTMNNDELHFFLQEFNEVFWNICYKDYSDKYDMINHCQYHTIRSYKLQKTLPSQGYHLWHCEHMNRDQGDRLAVYTVFLNDIPEGGETEFLYQGVRVPPKKGTVCIFPAGYTHAHRGNPPIGETKYIMTGWIVFK